MRKKAIFLGDMNNSIHRVYSYEIKERLSQLVDIYESVIDKDNILDNLYAVQKAEFAFSTWGMPIFTEEEVKKFMPKLKVLFYAAGSVQYFARPFLKNNIKIASAWVANGIPVAEYTVSQILLANKGFFQCSAMAKGDYPLSQSFFHSFPGNYGIKVGLLGIGVIGSKVAELLKPYDIEVLAYDPFLSDERAAELNIKKASLEEIFSGCQTISNHLANLPATVGLLNAKYFNLMGTNATFINTGRGAQVVEEDLAAALMEVPTRTALLDVTIEEPLAEGSALKKLGNVFITPHIAGSSGNEVVRMAQFMLEELERLEKGEELKFEVTLKMLETMA